METVLLFSIFIALFLLNVPIAISLAVAAITILALTSDFSLHMIVQRMFASLLSPPLLAIPLSLQVWPCPGAALPNT